MSDTNNVKLGVCKIFYGGVDLGYTKGGVEVTVTTSTKEVKVDQFGETPISEIITGRQVMVKAPLAETTLDNLIATMPGASLVTGGAKATGTVTFLTAPPVNGDKITLAGQDFTFKTAPVANTSDMAIPSTIQQAASRLADEINDYAPDFSAEANGAVVTITALRRGTLYNATLTKTFVTTANCTVSGATLTGGVNPNTERVDVKTGTNMNLLSLAKKLRLRPIGTTGAEDFIVWKAACPGGLNFSYQHDNERVYNAEFKGYPDASDRLFAFGDETAV